MFVKSTLAVVAVLASLAGTAAAPAQAEATKPAPAVVGQVLAQDLEDVKPGTAREAAWNELFDAGVDHINTDDLVALEQFLTARTR